jgi:hypothetical protein
MGAAVRLDHVIAEVSDILESMAALLGAGYPEAWPVGPFWPSALTSGVCAGTFNLELMQPLHRRPGAPAITTLVYEPVSADWAAAMLSEAGLAYEVREKVEPDADLLRLRGFSEADAAHPQRICTNVVPTDPPFPFFFCDYAPFLKVRLDPARFEVPRPVTELRFGLSDFKVSMRLVEQLGLALAPIRFEPAEKNGAEIWW